MGGKRKVNADDRLNELYARALAEDVATGTEGPHATPEQLLALVRGEGREEQRLELLDHVMSCEACLRRFELLRSIDVAGVKTEPKRSWRILPLAVAASVALMLGAAVAQRMGVFSSPDIMRGSRDAVTLLAPATAHDPAQPLAFAWRPVAGAERYELEIFDSTDSLIFTATTGDTTAAPTTFRLEPRAEYRWLVRAITPAGPRTSALRLLHLRR
jgi:hypothetical protein